MSKGGSSSSQVEIPAWLENAAIENINKARGVSQIGYTPYYGPDVAAFSPMQQQAMQATGSAAQAFGLAPQGFDATAGMPQAQEFAGGLMGYSSAPLFEESVDTLRQKRPAQAQAIEGMFIDPYTGQYTGGSQFAPTVDQIAQSGYAERAQNREAGAANMAEQRAHEEALARWNAMQDHSTNVTVNPADINQYDYSHGDEISFASSYNPGDINVDSSLTGGSMTYDTEQGPITISPEMGFNPIFDPTVDASMVGGTVTGGSMNMDSGPITVQTETGPVTVDPNISFDPTMTGGAVSYQGGDTQLASYAQAQPSDLQVGDQFQGDDGNVYTVGYEAGQVDPNLANLVGGTSAVTSAYEFPNITSEPLVNGQLSDPNDPQWDYSDFGGNSNLYNDPAEEWLMNQPVTPANNYGVGSDVSVPAPSYDYSHGNEISGFDTTQLAPIGTTQPALSAGGGLVPQTDFGLMDLAGTAIATTPTNLIINALTGGSSYAENPNIPVEDFGSQTTSLPAFEPIAVANPLTQTYNQAYWADKVASGVSQADMAAEQAAIADAGGKVYVGSTPNKNNNNSGGGGGGGGTTNSGSGGGTYCCTKMRDNGEWTSLKRVYKMHKWHFEQPQWWRDGYDVWGKVVADKWLGKSNKFNAKLMNAFYEHRVNKGKLTAKSALAHVIMYPPVFAMGMLAKLTGRHILEVKIES